YRIGDSTNTYFKAYISVTGIIAYMATTCSKSLRMSASFQSGRTQGGLPSWRSNPPWAKTVAKSRSQWKKPCCSAILSVTRSQGCASKTVSTLAAAPESARWLLSNSLSSAQLSPSNIDACPASRAAFCDFVSSVDFPGGCSHAPFHSSTLGGAISVSVRGQNHNAHQAS